jgi:hypothetical protein
MLEKKLIGEGKDHPVSEFIRRRNSEFAPWNFIFAGCSRLRIVDLPDNLTDRLKVIAAGVGKLDVATGADEEAGTKMTLEFGDLSADARKRRPEFAASCRETPSVDNRKQHLHRVQTIHARIITASDPDI